MAQNGKCLKRDTFEKNSGRKRGRYATTSQRFMTNSRRNYSRTSLPSLLISFRTGSMASSLAYSARGSTTAPLNSISVVAAQSSLFYILIAITPMLSWRRFTASECTAFSEDQTPLIYVDPINIMRPRYRTLKIPTSTSSPYSPKPFRCASGSIPAKSYLFPANFGTLRKYLPLPFRFP